MSADPRSRTDEVDRCVSDRRSRQGNDTSSVGLAADSDGTAFDTAFPPPVYFAFTDFGENLKRLFTGWAGFLSQFSSFAIAFHSFQPQR